MTNKEIVEVVYNAVDDKKGININVLDVSKISSIADYFVIAGGNNPNQVQAMADNVREEMHKLEINPKHIEGFRGASWILMDYGDIVVHIFNEDDREFYDLERIWKDADIVEM